MKKIESRFVGTFLLFAFALIGIAIIFESAFVTAMAGSFILSGVVYFIITSIYYYIANRHVLVVIKHLEEEGYNFLGRVSSSRSKEDGRSSITDCDFWIHLNGAKRLLSCRSSEVSYINGMPLKHVFKTEGGLQKYAICQAPNGFFLWEAK